MQVLRLQILAADMFSVAPNQSASADLTAQMEMQLIRHRISCLVMKKPGRSTQINQSKLIWRAIKSAVNQTASAASVSPVQNLHRQWLTF